MKQFFIPKVTNFTGWKALPVLNDFAYPWLDEEPPKTEFRAYQDGGYLHFQFVAYGLNPLVYVKDNNKMEVIHSERVELFFRSDEKMKPYFCLEMDPMGRVLDYQADFYRIFDREWKWPESLCIQTKIKEDCYTVEGKMSLSVLKQLGLLRGNQMQVGVFRGHCVELEGDNSKIKWISWVDSKTENPDFHVPTAFGLFILS